MRTRTIFCAAVAMMILFAASPARSHVNLVTVPTREGTQLTIYNSEDITMVREHRLLTVKKGINRIQFSWADTLIDPTSIDFRILDHVDKVDLLDTTFPSGRNDALQWNIMSRMDGKVPVEIRYFTSGITWEADYVGMADADETKLGFKGYVRVYNNSGERYDNAEVRLVVGTINLIEKIADLANKPPPGSLYVTSGESSRRALHGAFYYWSEEYECREKAGAPEDDGIVREEESKDVKKQGLSEYFLFTIEGREDIKDGEPKRMVTMDVAEVPLDAIYKLTDRDGGQLFTKFYRFKNRKLLDPAGEEKALPDMENLGVSPLPDGMVRLFSEYDNKDLAYVGGTSTKYIPIGDRVEVNVGRDSDVTMARRLKDQYISNIVARQYKRRLNNHWVMYYDLIDYDETFVYEEETVCGKSADTKVEVERRFDANVILWGSDGKPKDWNSDEPGAYVDLHEVGGRIEKVDRNHVKYFLDMKPGEKRTVTYTVTYKHRKIGPELNHEKKLEPLK